MLGVLELTLLNIQYVGIIRIDTAYNIQFVGTIRINTA